MTDLAHLLTMRTVADALYDGPPQSYFTGDHPLAGLQVRISAAGKPFHPGHGAGVPPDGGKPSTPAEKAHHEATVKAEAKRKAEFLAAHHAKESLGHATAAEEHARRALSSHKHEDIKHHAAQAAERHAQAVKHAEELEKHAPGSDSFFVARVSASNAGVLAANAAKHLSIAEGHATEARGEHAAHVERMQRESAEANAKLTQRQAELEAARATREKAASDLSAAQTKLAVGKAKPRTVELAQKRLGEAQSDVSRHEFGVDWLGSRAKTMAKRAEEMRAKTEEYVARHVEDSMRGRDIIARASGDVARGDHGVDFHVSPGVHPASYGSAAATIERMVGHDADLQQRLRDNGTTAYIYKDGTRFTDHAPFTALRGKKSTNGVEYQSHAAGVAAVPHNGKQYLAAPESRAAGDHTLTHEVGHAVHFASMSTPNFDATARSNYASAKARDAMPSKYSGDNHYEHFAELTAAWHGASLDGRDRAWVKTHDPQSAAFMSKIYGG